MNEPYKSFSGDRRDMIFELAHQFFELGKRGYKNRSKNEPLPFASISNIAFSAELYLKILHEQYGQPQRGHDLLNHLFVKLREQDQKLIIERLTLLHIFRTRGKNITREKLIQHLENHSQLFEGFRYLYDSKERKKAFKTEIVDFRFIVDFVDVVKVICNERK
tara:strand:+ start:5542 stop:6030 length:489 start_codon:yes stop_codon:yes gene_type:complete